MTTLGNGTIRRIVAGVTILVIGFLATQVLLNANRITAVEVEISTIKKGLNDNRSATERYRLENREDHAYIIKKLDHILERIK